MNPTPPITLCDTKPINLSSAGPPRILRATHLGMCFGVRDAIALAVQERAAAPLTVLGELVHNEAVLEDLRRRDIRIEPRLEQVGTAAVMITAHGASEALRRRVRERGLRVLEATCPLVHFAHRAVAELVAAGFHPVIIGKRDHVEVRGLTEDLAEFDVVLTEVEVEGLRERPRFGVAAQTTQPVEKVRRLVGRLRRRFPRSEVRFADTVCQPTKLRQDAASALARQCEVVVVIGGAHSNNTRELVATCARHCARVHHVQSADEVAAGWLVGARTIGLTAGTSTPDAVIVAVERRVRELAGSGPEAGLGADVHAGAAMIREAHPPPAAPAAGLPRGGAFDRNLQPAKRP